MPEVAGREKRILLTDWAHWQNLAGNLHLQSYTFSCSWLIMAWVQSSVCSHCLHHGLDGDVKSRSLSPAVSCSCVMEWR